MEDIRPTHFAVREMDRSDQGVLNRIYETLDGPARQELLRFAVDLQHRSGQRN